MLEGDDRAANVGGVCCGIDRAFAAFFLFARPDLAETPNRHGMSCVDLLIF